MTRRANSDRFAATYAFYRSGFARSAERLRRYLEQSGGGVLDEPATYASYVPCRSRCS